MKKTRIIGKKQILTLTMVLALGAAIWLNVKYSTNGADFFTSSKKSDAELGETKYVATNSVAYPEKENYFEKAKKEREQKREEALALLEETLEDVKSTDEAKVKVADEITKITTASQNESEIETLLKAKGFENAVAVISDDVCNIVIGAKDELEKSETVQILDIVNSITEINLENIKIVTVK